MYDNKVCVDFFVKRVLPPLLVTARISTRLRAIREAREAVERCRLSLKKVEVQNQGPALLAMSGVELEVP